MGNIVFERIVVKNCVYLSNQDLFILINCKFYFVYSVHDLTGIDFLNILVEKSSIKCIQF